MLSAQGVTYVTLPAVYFFNNALFRRTVPQALRHNPRHMAYLYHTEKSGTHELQLGTPFGLLLALHLPRCAKSSAWEPCMHRFELLLSNYHFTPQSTPLLPPISSFEVSWYSVCARLAHLSKLRIHGLSSLQGSPSGTTLAYSKHAICLWQQPLITDSDNNESILGTLTFDNRWLMCAWARTTRVNKYCFRSVNCINKQAHMKGHSVKSDAAETVPVLKNNLVTLQKQ